MIRASITNRTGLRVNDTVEGESIEAKVERMVSNKEPVELVGAKAIYQERKEGVMAAYNIRTDRWEIAVEGMDKIQKSRQARREEKPETKVIDLNKKQEDGGAESTHGE